VAGLGLPLERHILAAGVIPLPPERLDGLRQVAVDHATRLCQTRLMEDGAEIFDAGTLREVLDRSYPLAKAGEAQRVLKEGEITGRVVLKID
jgi:NADPH:quinone reductase-like Zn-dependent oxidoreductase